MSPADNMAESASVEFANLLQEIQPIRFDWQETESVLIINNRRMLHGRESATDDPNRLLESILVHEKL
ncbi:MAG: TauD/TfdA family dioxygenase [Phycisphaeraceae bacterium]|nr:TauD/TfdA family dioxygenase [Phycisphaeraceae bacterium]